MNPSLIVLWALVGWCGTVPRPRFPPPPDPPDPGPCLVCGVIGAIAGIIGGWAFTQVFLPTDQFPIRSAIYAAATTVGAFVAGRIASDIYAAAATRKR